MILFALYCLASLDGMLCGYRSAAGRCPLIRNWRFNVRSMVRGLMVAQVASLLALVTLLAVVYFSHDSAPLLGDLNRAATRMLNVFGCYAALVLFNLALRVLPSVDIKSATSVLFLGPLTALRPFVMVVGTVFGVWGSALLTTKALGAFVLALMLSLEWLLGRVHDRIQERELHLLVPAGEGAAAGQSRV